MNSSSSKISTLLTNPLKIIIIHYKVFDLNYSLFSNNTKKKIQKKKLKKYIRDLEFIFNNLFESKILFPSYPL